MESTLLLIKPNAIKGHHIGEIIKILEDNHFQIKHLRSFNMSDRLAAEFYIEHRDKEFYSELVKFMQSGLIIGIVVNKENAVKELRDLVGKTNPAEAKVGTIRYLYGESLRYNAVHASDSHKSAQREIELIFPSI